jgi:hypothetical protein
LIIGDLVTKFLGEMCHVEDIVDVIQTVEPKSSKCSLETVDYNSSASEGTRVASEFDHL